jgi:hypothetical protein
MGSEEKLTLSKLPEILGESMPELPFTSVGRLRLVNALQQRFGMNYRSLPGTRDVLSEFDKQCETHSVISKNMESKNG